MRCKFTSVALISLAASLCECSDEQFYRESFSGDEIAFTAEVSDVWTAGTRSDADSVSALKAAAFQMQTTDGTDSIYIHQTTADRFVSSTGNGDSLLTRGTPIDNDSFATLNVGVFASVFKGEWDDSNEMNYMHNVRYSTKDGELSSDEGTYFWPESKDKNVKLFAYAPYNDSSIKFDEEKAGSPKFHYTVASKPEEQKDILVASTSTKGDTQLTFNHALTAVKFKTGDALLPGTIKSIKIKNIYMEGEYSFADNSWSIPSDAEKQDFYYECDKVFSNASGVPDYVKVDKDQNIFGDGDGLTLLMIPQKINKVSSSESSDGDSDEEGSKNPQIEIEYLNTILETSTTYTIDFDINWGAGETVTYKISSSSISVEYTFFVDASKSEFYPFGYKSGSAKATSITSYCTITDAKTGNTSNKPVTFTISYPEGKPSWMSGYYPFAGERTNSEKNATLGYSESVTVPSSFTADPTSAEWNQLKNKQSVTDYDLSTAGGKIKRNTANCYIVNAPGTYKIPLVYGNAIKNDREYSESYRSAISDNTGSYLKEFRRHDDKPINAAWIKAILRLFFNKWITAPRSQVFNPLKI